MIRIDRSYCYGSTQTKPEKKNGSTKARKIPPFKQGGKKKGCRQACQTAKSKERRKGMEGYTIHHPRFFNCCRYAHTIIPLSNQWKREIIIIPGVSSWRFALAHRVMSRISHLKLQINGPAASTVLNSFILQIAAPPHLADFASEQRIDSFYRFSDIIPQACDIDEVSVKSCFSGIRFIIECNWLFP